MLLHLSHSSLFTKDEGRKRKKDTEGRDRGRKSVKLNVLHFYLCNFHDFDSCQLARLDMTTLEKYMKKMLRSHQTKKTKHQTYKDSVPPVQ